MKFPNACILQFGKLPRVGRVKTRLIPVLGAEKAMRLHVKLLGYTWQLLNAAQIAPMQLWTDVADESSFGDALIPPATTHRVQQGNDLGERMAHAIDEALAVSESVVIIGSDCPMLDAAYLNNAFEALQQGVDVVLGPANDGGYVLIGMSQPHPGIFKNIAWGSDQVLVQTRSHLQAMGCRWHELPERWDVDRPEDLFRLEGLMLP